MEEKIKLAMYEIEKEIGQTEKCLNDPIIRKVSEGRIYGLQFALRLIKKLIEEE